ncbi:MAG: PorV/PorQ family protein [Elusimicrobiota bacterium]
MRITFSILLLIQFLPFQAGAVSGERATTAGTFLKLPAGARSVSLGEACSAGCGGPDALFWNPARLGVRPELGSSGPESRPRHSAALSHVEYLEGSSLEQAAYSYSSSWGSVGAGFRYLSVGRIVETDETGASMGSFSPSDAAFLLGYARTLGEGASFLEGFSLGASAKYLESQVLAMARSWAVDLGILSPSYLGNSLSFAAVLRNLGGDLKFETESEELPLEGRLGAACRFLGSWQVSLDIGIPRDDDLFGAMGVEYSRRAGKDWTVSGRAGFNSKLVGDVRGFSGAAFGLGLGFRGLGFDYALRPMGSLGSPHHFTLTVSF